MVATWNRLLHGYGVIDEDAVWEIVSRDIPVRARRGR